MRADFAIASQSTESLGTLLTETPVEESSDRYFQYDAMNRQTVVNAADASGSLGSEGRRITYDRNGNRTSETRNGVRLVEQGAVRAVAFGLLRHVVGI